MAAKLKKGDTVVVLTGKDKGKTGEITAVSPKDNQAVVDGVNVAIRHTKQSATSQGGKATRVGFRMEGDKKVRYAKTTGEAI